MNYSRISLFFYVCCSLCTLSLSHTLSTSFMHFAENHVKFFPILFFKKKKLEEKIACWMHSVFFFFNFETLGDLVLGVSEMILHAYIRVNIFKCRMRLIVDPSLSHASF